MSGEGKMRMDRRMYGRRTERHIPAIPDPIEMNLFVRVLNNRILESTEQFKKQFASTGEKLGVNDNITGVKSLDFSSMPVREEDLHPRLPDESDYRLLSHFSSSSILDYDGENHFAIHYRRCLYRLRLSALKKKMFLPVVMAAGPACPVFEKLPFGNGFLADILLRRYAFGQSWSEISSDLSSRGLIIKESLLRSVCMKLGHRMWPLYSHLLSKVLSSRYIQIDDDSFDLRNGFLGSVERMGSLWCLADVACRNAAFIYDMSINPKIVALSLLKDSNAIVQGNCYDSLELCEGLGNLYLAAFWKPVKEKFQAAINENNNLASDALFMIDAVYSVEERLEKMEYDVNSRKAIREREAYPWIRKLENWMAVTVSTAGLGPRLLDAILFTYKRIPMLTTYVKDGGMMIDGTFIESAVSCVRNSLSDNEFCCSDSSDALCTAIFKSFASTCHLRGKDPWQWLSDTLAAISRPSFSTADLSGLMP